MTTRTPIAVLALLAVGAEACIHADVHTTPVNAPLATAPTHDEELGQRVSPEQRWLLTDPRAIEDLGGTTFGEKEITEFWTRKGWRLTKREERYLSEVGGLMNAAVVSRVSRWSTCPFAPVYQTLKTVTVLGQTVPAFHEFYLDADAGSGKLAIGTPRFKRTSDYEEEHPDGHVDAPAAH